MPLRRHAKRCAAVAILVTTMFGLHLANRPATADLAQLPFRYAFSRQVLPEVPGPERRSVRPMHPDFRNISAFMSSLGAGAAFADIDGDGLPNDICYVDTITDQVILAPAPGTGDRYKPFALNPNLRGALYTRATMAPAGCLAADIDEDGRTDLLVYYEGRTPLAFLSRPRREDEPPAADNFVPVDVIPGGRIIATGSATFADLDGSGHLALILANYFADGIDFLNAAGTERVALPNSLATADNGGGARIYRCLPKMDGSERSAACTEVPDALPPSLAKGWGLAVGAQDLDDDLYPEIFIANDFGPDQLLWNRSSPGQIKFELVKGPLSPVGRTQNSLGRDSFKGMGVDFADLNGDGIPDIAVSSISEHELMESQQIFVSTGERGTWGQGVAPYGERGDELGLLWSGWAWDVKFADFTNKGWADVVQATGFLKGTINRWPEFQEFAFVNDLLMPLGLASWPKFIPGTAVSGDNENPFYMRLSDKGRFINIAKQIGFGEHDVSRGIAIGDVDGSGRLSMVVANQWGTSTFYRNECSPCGKALELSLRLPVSATDTRTRVVKGYPVPSLRTRPATHASVAVTTPSGRHLTAQIDGGNGHSGKRSHDLHFGVGGETAPVTVDVKWRADGRIRHETLQLEPGWYTIILGSGPMELSARAPNTAE